MARYNSPTLLIITLGLAPFARTPFTGKAENAFAGTLARLIDIFDLFMHGNRLCITGAKTTATLSRQPGCVNEQPGNF